MIHNLQFVDNSLELQTLSGVVSFSTTGSNETFVGFTKIKIICVQFSP